MLLHALPCAQEGQPRIKCTKVGNMPWRAQWRARPQTGDLWLTRRAPGPPGSQTGLGGWSSQDNQPVNLLSPMSIVMG